MITVTTHTSSKFKTVFEQTGFIKRFMEAYADEMRKAWAARASGETYWRFGAPLTAPPIPSKLTVRSGDLNEALKTKEDSKNAEAVIERVKFNGERISLTKGVRDAVIPYAWRQEKQQGKTGRIRAYLVPSIVDVMNNKNMLEAMKQRAIKRALQGH